MAAVRAKCPYCGNPRKPRRLGGNEVRHGVCNRAECAAKDADEKREDAKGEPDASLAKAPRPIR